MFFFFKQKTAYEVRISDWSSDVCSSDLVPRRHQGGDADRLAPQLDLGIRQVRGDTHDVRPLGLLGEILDEGGAVVDLAARRSEERRVGKECVIRVDLGGRRIIKKKKHNKQQ